MPIFTDGAYVYGPFSSPTRKKFIPQCFRVFLLSLCRASIVQKRIIYFQDEGPLTRRMCEKGRLLYRHGMNNLPPVSYPFRLPAASLFRSPLLLSFSPRFFLNHYFLLYLILMQGFHSAVFCCGMWMIVNEYNLWLCMTLDATPSNRSKELCCASSPFLRHTPAPHPTLTSSLQLATFLNHSSAAWWTPLSSVSCTNERRLHTSLVVICISAIFNTFSRFFLFPPPFSHVCEESLYGDATDKPLLDCCACGTAKYRVTFYGNWSEKIHPKDYPREDKSFFVVFFLMSPELRKTFSNVTNQPMGKKKSISKFKKLCLLFQTLRKCDVTQW